MKSHGAFEMSAQSTANLHQFGYPGVTPFELLDLPDRFPWTCPVCNRHNATKWHLRTHYMIHTGEKPQQCPHCDYRTIQSGVLKRHIQKKHPLH